MVEAKKGEPLQIQSGNIINELNGYFKQWGNEANPPQWLKDSKSLTDLLSDFLEGKLRTTQLEQDKSVSTLLTYRGLDSLKNGVFDGKEKYYTWTQKFFASHYIGNKYPTQKENAIPQLGVYINWPGNENGDTNTVNRGLNKLIKFYSEDMRMAIAEDGNLIRNGASIAANENLTKAINFLNNFQTGNLVVDLQLAHFNPYSRRLNFESLLNMQYVEYFNGTKKMTFAGKKIGSPSDVRTIDNVGDNTPGLNKIWSAVDTAVNMYVSN